MVAILLAQCLLIILPFITAQAPEECCLEKEVGGILYRYVRSGAVASQCSNNCIYEKVDRPGKYFCFAPGDLHVECEDDEVTEAPGGGEGSEGTGDEESNEENGGGDEEGNEDNGGGDEEVEDNTAAYCALNSEHTMCKYDGPSADCASKTIFTGLSEAGKTAILERHNELRRRVAKGEETEGLPGPQPAASNMRKLVWDEELAAIAQRWTDQCTFGHDTERDLLDGTYTGQNAYWSGNSAESVEADVQTGLAGATQAWYDEVSDPGFNPASINPYQFSSGVGHYTQVVWAETDRIGCGVVYYKENNFYNTLVNCNYATGGNFINAAMYLEGDFCTACPTGYSCDDGLCVAP